MLGIDRNVPLRVGLERVPAGGNRARIVGAAIEWAHRIDAALARNEKRTGHARRTPCLVAHAARLLVGSCDPPSERRRALRPRKLPDEGSDTQNFRCRYDRAHVAAVAAPLAAGGAAVAGGCVGVTERDQRVDRERRPR